MNPVLSVNSLDKETKYLENIDTIFKNNDPILKYAYGDTSVPLGLSKTLQQPLNFILMSYKKLPGKNNPFPAI